MVLVEGVVGSGFGAIAAHLGTCYLLLESLEAKIKGAILCNDVSLPPADSALAALRDSTRCPGKRMFSVC